MGGNASGSDAYADERRKVHEARRRAPADLGAAVEGEESVDIWGQQPLQLCRQGGVGIGRAVWVSGGR